MSTDCSQIHINAGGNSSRLKQHSVSPALCLSLVKTNLSEQNTNDRGSAVCTCEIRGSSEWIREPEPDTSVCREHK